MNNFAKASATLLGLFSASAWAAGELQGQLNVQLTVGSGCTITNGGQTGGTNTFGTLAFGDYTGLDNIIDGRSLGSGGGSSFGVQCSLGTNYTIAIDNGANSAGGQRRMQSGGEFIEYDLYQDSARAVPWGDGGAGGTVLAGTGTGTSEEVIVYGRVPPQTTPSPGTYLDTVQVTISW
ncbi:Csu type fimbrial protein [Pseudomonas subflava]|uniref:Csu type fimbrial protein n=1 Tax=Pseudomonas subflava TaxID=2952933 RepID=UPI00207A1C54|nr:spore coat U domain-containing protein [Pseudomonas subflava]